MSDRATLVLVHGAWHGTWCWERLIPCLSARGVATRTVDLPSISRNGAPTGGLVRERPSVRGVGLREDAAAVRAVIESIEGPVVLCGHSYGGMVISLAASRSARGAGAGAVGDSTRIKRLVYLCAFMPEERQSLVAIGGNQHAPWIRMLDDDMTLPDLSRAADVFYGDCDEAMRAWAIAQLKPQSNVAFITPVARPAWRDIASTYIVCARDGAMPPELQRTLFAPRAERALELDSSHSPFLSQPAALAEALASQL